MRIQKPNREVFFKHFYPPASWEKELELKPENSIYYALMVEKLGKAMADFYWQRRYTYEVDRDYEWRNLCKEISEKSEAFLKKRGIEIFKY